MENAETILVIFLSVALAIFLTLSIILVSICIKIARHVKNITEKAEQVVDKAEDIAEFFGHASTPMAIGKIIASVRDAVARRNKRKE